jgi:hypothetical protein
MRKTLDHAAATDQRGVERLDKAGDRREVPVVLLSRRYPLLAGARAYDARDFTVGP